MGIVGSASDVDCAAVSCAGETEAGIPTVTGSVPLSNPPARLAAGCRARMSATAVAFAFTCSNSLGSMGSAMALLSVCKGPSRTGGAAGTGRPGTVQAGASGCGAVIAGAGVEPAPWATEPDGDWDAGGAGAASCPTGAPRPAPGLGEAAGTFIPGVGGMLPVTDAAAGPAAASATAGARGGVDGAVGAAAIRDDGGGGAVPLFCW